MWQFQNRRNRKPPDHQRRNHTIETGSSDRKRKAEGCDTEENSWPSQRRRGFVPSSPITPPAQPSPHDEWTASSLGNSVDTTTSWSEFTNFKGQKFSATSLSSAGSSVDLSPFSTPSSSPVARKAATRVSEGSNHQVDGPSDSLSSLLFNEEGFAMLDFDDLQLDMTALEAELTPGTAGFLDFSPPLPAALAAKQPLPDGLQFEVGAMENLDVPAAPSAGEQRDVERLLSFDYDAFTSMLCANEALPEDNDCQNDYWQHASPPMEVDSSDDTSGFLSLESLLAASSRSSSQGGTSTGASINSNDAHDRSSSSPFDFSLDSLGITDIVEQNVNSFKGDTSHEYLPFDQQALGFLQTDAAALDHADLFWPQP